ncbi:glycosyltransferase [bacterium]|nr:glycosyltransferase [bacterium]
MISFSVIICSHNPRRDYLRQVLAALQNQTLSFDSWELFLIDNGSNEPLAASWDLSWHPLGRHVREEKLGLTPARLRGIAEARGKLLVFVDDDNVLAPDYLERSREIAARWPMLGAWGGNLVGRFETPPPDWLVPHLRMLAIHQVDRDVWSNHLRNIETCPAGAGMVVRATVAKEYARRTVQDEARSELDRKGSSLVSCGDLDLAYTACDLGLGTGLFKCLTLEHLIPAVRLRKDYVLRLREAQTYSRTILNSFRGVAPTEASKRVRFATLRSVLARIPLVSSKGDRIAQELFEATERGRRAAFEQLSRVRKPTAQSRVSSPST